MKTHQTILKAGFLFVLITATTQLASAATFERDITGDFIAQSGKSLEIETGSGDINVRSGEDDSVLLQVKLSVNASSQEKADELFEKIEVDILESASGVQVEIRKNSGSSFWGWLFGKRTPAVEVYAICPKSSHLVLDTGSGNITVTGIEGGIFLDTGSGDISCENLAGSVESDTGSGNISITGLSGDLSGDTGSGDIRILDLNGTFTGDTGSGNIQARGSIRFFSADTGSGDVVIESTLSDLDPSSISSGSGNIDLYLPLTANAQFSGSTNSGSVQADFPNAEVISVSKKAVELVLGDNGALISAQTGSGDVSLYATSP